MLTEAAGELPGTAAGVSVVRFGSGRFGAARACGTCAEHHGASLVIAEGGPTLLRGMLAEGLVDDLVLTLAPLLVAGDGRLAAARARAGPARAARARATPRASGDHLFLHYRGRGVSPAPVTIPACGGARTLEFDAGRPLVDGDRQHEPGLVLRQRPAGHARAPRSSTRSSSSPQGADLIDVGGESGVTYTGVDARGARDRARRAR